MRPRVHSYGTVLLNTWATMDSIDKEDAESRPMTAGTQTQNFVDSVLGHINNVILRAASVKSAATTEMLFNLKEVELKDVSAKIREAFDAMATEKTDGGLTGKSIDREEFMTGCRKMGKQLTAEECDNWIADADVDNNGVVDYEEFEHIVRKAFELECESKCTICCMHAIDSSSTASRASTDADEHESALMQRMRKIQIKNSLNGNEEMKGLGMAIIETNRLQQQIKSMNKGALFQRASSGARFCANKCARVSRSLHSPCQHCIRAKS